MDERRARAVVRAVLPFVVAFWFASLLPAFGPAYSVPDWRISCIEGPTPYQGFEPR